MLPRFALALSVLAAAAGLAPAEPLRWGWTLTSAGGELLGSGSGLTTGLYVFDKLPVPVLPTEPPVPSDFTNPDDYVRSVTSAGTLRLTDDRTNTTAAFDVFFTKKEAWRLTTNPDGSTSPEAYDSWGESGPANWSGRVRSGGLLFEVRQWDQYSHVVVDMVETPEPGTLILSGIALAGGLGLLRRRR